MDAGGRPRSDGQRSGRRPARGCTPAADSSGASIFTAIQEQLGLKLESQKGQVEGLVIDHVARPSDDLMVATGMQGRRERRNSTILIRGAGHVSRGAIRIMTDRFACRLDLCSKLLLSMSGLLSVAALVLFNLLQITPAHAKPRLKMRSQASPTPAAGHDQCQQSPARRSQDLEGGWRRGTKRSSIASIKVAMAFPCTTSHWKAPW